MVTAADIETAHARLDEMDAEATDTKTVKLDWVVAQVIKLDRVVALAEACADHAPENNAIINAGREALREMATLFGFEVPGLVTSGEGRSDRQ
jgi:hypothetical protein